MPADETADLMSSDADTANPQQRSRRLLWLTLSVAAGVVIVDQLTKAWAIANLKNKPPVELLGEWLRLNYLENSGAAFSLGTGFTLIFTAIAVVVVVVIVRTASRLGSVGWAIALGGLLGGALGNLIDRLTRAPGIGRGHVVDFIQLPHWPVFNVADMSIVCSAVLMVFLALRGVDVNGRRSSSVLASGQS